MKRSGGHASYILEADILFGSISNLQKAFKPNRDAKEFVPVPVPCIGNTKKEYVTTEGDEKGMGHLYLMRDPVGFMRSRAVFKIVNTPAFQDEGTCELY